MTEHAACADRKKNTHTLWRHMSASFGSSVISQCTRRRCVCVCVCVCVSDNLKYSYLDDLENRKKRVTEQRQVFNDQ